ncbi:MAG: extracellular solute-binding protein [Thermomicrobiales bacterium]
MAALAQETIRGTLAAEEGKPVATFYDWELNLHPGIYAVGDAQGVAVEVAPTENFGNDRFIAEANDQSSTWDMYGGVTPFLEMLQLVATGTIEPWDAYVTDEIKADLFPATLEEGSVDGSWYVWPLLLDICVQASNGAVLEKAGIDPTVAPATWDEFIANAQKVQESGAAPYGLTFDNRDWRSLIPVTHSISTDVYSRTVSSLQQRCCGRGARNHEANDGVDQRGHSGRCRCGQHRSRRPGHLGLGASWVLLQVPECPVDLLRNLADPSKLTLARLPKTEAGVGGTVFWDTGAVLFKYGANKAKMVEFIQAIQQDQAIWENSVQGNPDEGTTPVGQMPVTQSTWANWEAETPEFISSNPWVFDIRDALADARAIAPSLLSIKQFDVARPLWHKYLSGETADARTAGQEALDAVAAEYKAQTGNDPQL